MSDKEKNFKSLENKWLGRSLENYKSMHAKTAEDRGVSRQFQSAQSLTSARKILWGIKRGNSLLKK